MPQPKQINRRHFLGVSAGLACTAVASTCSGYSAATDSAGNRSPIIAGYRPRIGSAWINRGEATDSGPLLEKALSAATDFSWLSRGDRVLIKLALNSGNPYPATSDPWMVQEMVSILQRKGAGVVLAGDQSGVQDVHWTKTSQKGSSRELCRSAGLLKAIEESGARPVFFEEAGYDAYFPSTPEGSHHWKNPLWLPAVLKEIDHIVYLPRVSSHVMGDITAGLKLPVGFLREDSRREFHRGGADFYAMYEEINQVPEIKSKLRLTVTSGRSVLSTLGPNSGHISQPDVGLLFASEDLLANELLSYAWLQWNRKFETSAFNRVTVGSVTNFRSFINRQFVKGTWKREDAAETPDIDMFRPGSIYDHPAIVNRMTRKGGRPESLDWKQVNSHPDLSVPEYVERALAGTALDV